MRAALTGWRFLKFLSLVSRTKRRVVLLSVFSLEQLCRRSKSLLSSLSLSLSLYISRDARGCFSRARKFSFSLVFKMTNFFPRSNFFLPLLKKREFVMKRGGTKRQTGGDFESEDITTLRIVDRGVVVCSCSVRALFILSRAICTYIFYINILIYRSVWFCRRLVDPRELPSLRWYRRRRRLSGIRRRRRNHRP
jgi:hypothetical protein